MKTGLDCLLLFGVLTLRVSSDEVTLTTAVVRDETTPKPTTVFRRIHVDRVVEERIQAPLDLFRLRAPEIRRSRPNIWNWDYWCQLQPKTGNCSETLIRYYYDAQIDQCQSFTYKGCMGNKNNFNNMVDCERYCKGAAYASIKYSAQSSYCALQPNAGICLAMFEKYYYDVNEDTCKTYIYGGCGGNLNRFNSIPECKTKCHAEMSTITDM